MLLSAAETTTQSFLCNVPLVKVQKDNRNECITINMQFYIKLYDQNELALTKLKYNFNFSLTETTVCYIQHLQAFHISMHCGSQCSTKPSSCQHLYTTTFTGDCEILQHI